MNDNSPTSSADFAWPVRVYYEDTDAGGVVYHAGYLRFLERARTEWLRARGWSQERLRVELGLGFVVSTMNIAYRRAARLDDRLLATVAVLERRRASLIFRQTVCAAEQPAQTYVEADVEVACVDLASMRPRRIPDLDAPPVDATQ